MGFIGVQPASAPLTASDITDGVVSQAKLADQVVNEAKMQISNSPTNGYFLSAQSGNTGGLTWAESAGFDVSSITGATEATDYPQTTDEFVFSDAGTLKRADYNILNNHNSPYCFYLDTNGFSSSQSISANTWTTITNFDSNGSVSTHQQSGSLSSTLSSNGRFTPNMQGWYYVAFGCQLESVENGVEINTVAYSSHSDHSFTLSRYNTGGGGSTHYNMGSAVLSASSSSYFSFAIKHTDGAGSRNVTRAKVSIFRLPTKDLP